MNGLQRDTWISLWKPELEKEAGLIYDALFTIYEHPKICQKKYLTKMQAIIFVLAVLAFDNVGLPLITKLLGL